MAFISERYERFLEKASALYPDTTRNRIDEPARGARLRTAERPARFSSHLITEASCKNILRYLREDARLKTKEIIEDTDLPCFSLADRAVRRREESVHGDALGALENDLY